MQLPVDGFRCLSVVSSAVSSSLAETGIHLQRNAYGKASPVRLCSGNVVTLLRCSHHCCTFTDSKEDAKSSFSSLGAFWREACNSTKVRNPSAAPRRLSYLDGLERRRHSSYIFFALLRCSAICYADTAVLSKRRRSQTIVTSPQRADLDHCPLCEKRPWPQSDFNKKIWGVPKVLLACILQISFGINQCCSLCLLLWR